MASQKDFRNGNSYELNSQEPPSDVGAGKTKSGASLNGETERDALLPNHGPVDAELTGQTTEADPTSQRVGDAQCSPSWEKVACWPTAPETTATNTQRPLSCDEATCRICQDGDFYEKLVSPCRCSGTVGFVHVSCLNTWLQVTSRTNCELCGYPFPVTKQPAPLSEYLRNPRANMDLPNLVCDLACLVVLTPLLFTSLYLSSTGALRYESLGQAGSLCAVITLLVALMLVYVSWAVLAVVYHVRVWRVWRERHSSISMLRESQIINLSCHFKKGRPRRRAARGGSTRRPRGGGRAKPISRLARPSASPARSVQCGQSACTVGTGPDTAILLAPINRLSGWIRVNNRVSVRALHPV